MAQQKVDNFGYVVLYSQLINIGYEEDISFAAAQKFNDIVLLNDAIDWIEKNQNKIELKQEQKETTVGNQSVDIKKAVKSKQTKAVKPKQTKAAQPSNLWKYKKMTKWSNADILHWIQSMDLEQKWNEKLLNEIKNCECTGKEIRLLKSGKDVGQSFGITKNKQLCRDIATNIKNFKPVVKKKNISNKPFKINIFSQQKHLVLDEKVTKDVTVQYVKVLYKIQSGVMADVDDIQFYYQRKVLPKDNTLQQVNIVNDKHLISVQFKTDGAQ